MSLHIDSLVVDTIRQAQALIGRCSSVFDRFYFNELLFKYAQSLREEAERRRRWITAWDEACQTVWTGLPRRGWYLTGHESARLTHQLAKWIKAEDWQHVDNALLKHLPEFKVCELSQWLAQQNVPDYCINRVRLFLLHREAGDHESATYIGVPLIDELAVHFYKGKAFTTKRGNPRTKDQSKPEIAFKTVNGPQLTPYCEGFVQAFGSLQEDPSPSRLTEEDYWNRHAIVHGLMRRPMGVKDSAKCLMCIGFIIFAVQQEESADASASH